MEKLFKTLIQPDSILKTRSHFTVDFISLTDRMNAKFYFVAFQSRSFVHEFQTSVN